MTTDATLEPKLTAWDRRVLRHVPEAGEHEYYPRDVDQAVTCWQVAELLNHTNIVEVRATLEGLRDFQYLHTAVSRSRKRQVYWRSRRGDKAAASPVRTPTTPRNA